jgi:hypothetical protein
MGSAMLTSPFELLSTRLGTRLGKVKICDRNDILNWAGGYFVAVRSRHAHNEESP